MKRKQRTSVTLAEKRAKIDRINEQVKKGKTLKAACTDVGIPMPYFYRWTGVLNDSTYEVAKPSARPFDMPKIPPGVTCLIGTPQEIGEVLRGMK